MPWPFNKDASTNETMKELSSLTDDIVAKIKDATDKQVGATVVDAISKMGQLEIDLLPATMSNKELELAVEHLTSDHEAIIEALTDGP